HAAIILLCVLYQSGVLLRVKEFVLRCSSIASRIIGRVTLQLYQLLNHLVFTRSGEVEARGVPISLAIVAEMFKTRIAVAGAIGSWLIYPLQIMKNSLNRTEKAVQI